MTTPQAEWLETVQPAPSIKKNFYTILSSRNVPAEVEGHVTDDAYLRRCFRE